MYDILIVGAGPAGLTSAIYASLGGAKVLVLGTIPGGRLTEIAHISNYPGYSGTGSELAKLMLDQAKEAGAEVVADEVVDIVREEGKFVVKTAMGDAYEARSIVIATGMQVKGLGVKGEEELFGIKISYCAVCDGPLHKGEHVCVIGDDFKAASSAIYLASIARRVTWLYEKLDVERSYLRQAEELPNVELVQGTPSAFEKSDGRVKVLLSDGREFEFDFVFIEKGEAPANIIAQKVGVELDPQGFIKVDGSQATSVPGIFAAGDVTDFPVKQVVTACAQGAVAALSALKYLRRLGKT